MTEPTPAEFLADAHGPYHRRADRALPDAQPPGPATSSACPGNPATVQPVLGATRWLEQRRPFPMAWPVTVRAEVIQ